MKVYIIIYITIVFTFCFGCVKPIDLSQERQNYDGKLILNGVYFGKNESFLFWSNGICTIAPLKELFEERVNNTINSSIYGWGFFKNAGDSLFINTHAEFGREDIDKGYVINDTSFVLAFERSSPKYSAIDTFILDRAFQKPDSNKLKYYKIMLEQ